MSAFRLNELSGFRSVRAVGQRYRIIYAIQGEQVKVIVIAVGIRKEGSKADVYAKAASGLDSNISLAPAPEP